VAARTGKGGRFRYRTTDITTKHLKAPDYNIEEREIAKITWVGWLSLRRKDVI
jgi:hypothetical protein